MKVVAENGHSRHMLSDIGYGAPESSHGRLSSSGSLAMLAAMRRDRYRWLGALTCAKLGALCGGGCLRTNHLFAQSATSYN